MDLWDTRIGAGLLLVTHTGGGGGGSRCLRCVRAVQIRRERATFKELGDSLLHKVGPGQVQAHKPRSHFEKNGGENGAPQKKTILVGGTPPLPMQPVPFLEAWHIG